MKLSTSPPAVIAMFVLDSEGNRICAKYYDKTYPTLAEQTALEKKLFNKTKNVTTRLEAEIIMLEDIVSVFKFGSDTIMYAVGSTEENELILTSVLDGAFEAVSGMLRGHMDRSVMLDNLELLLLTFDEVVDGGIILETEGHAITNRVLMRGIDNEVPMSELTISQAFASARQQFSKSWMK